MLSTIKNLLGMSGQVGFYKRKNPDYTSDQAFFPLLFVKVMNIIHNSSYKLSIAYAKYTKNTSIRLHEHFCAEYRQLLGG